MPTSMQGERVPLVTTPTGSSPPSTVHPARGMPGPVKTNGASFSSVPRSACSRRRSAPMKSLSSAHAHPRPASIGVRSVERSLP